VANEPSAATAHSYAVNDLPALTGLGRTRIFQAISDGRLVARKFGRRTIVLRTDLDAFLQNLESAR
jgi:hypothetical protein